MQFRSWCAGLTTMSMKTSANDAEGLAAEVLVTGATGMIGRWLLASLTRKGRVTAALVRGAAKREAELRAFVDRIGGDANKLVVVEGDVEQEGIGLALALPHVRVVHHLAARFAFDLTREEARRSNVEGTRHVIQWACAQPMLERFVFLGGYRMTTIDLAALDDATLERRYASGAYEGSKFESYRLFRKLAAEHELRWTAVHPSGVIGDSRTGETTQVVGIGNTVQRLFAGDMPALAGSTDTFVPLVTVDYLAEYLASVPEREASLGKDLVVLDPASPPLPELVRRIAEALGVAAPTFSLPVKLVAALPSCWTGMHRESVGFLSTDRYDTREGDAHARAVHLEHPPLERALARWCEYLVSTRFLSEPSAEHGHFAHGVFTVGDPTASSVVLLHGIPFDSDAMSPIARRLGTSTARLDLPGLGRSAPGRIDAAWLGSVLARRTRPAVLVGHSLGAALAVRTAAAHPEKVAALVLIAPSFLMRPASWTMQLRPVVAHVLGGLTTQAAFEKRFVSDASELAGEAARSAIAALARKGVARRIADALAAATTQRARQTTLEAYRALSERGVPVLILHGSTEPLVEPTLNADVSRIEGAGHNLHLTHLEEIAPRSRAFVEHYHI